MVKLIVPLLAFFVAGCATTTMAQSKADNVLKHGFDEPLCIGYGREAIARYAGDNEMIEQLRGHVAFYEMAWKGQFPYDDKHKQEMLDAVAGNIKSRLAGKTGNEWQEVLLPTILDCAVKHEAYDRAAGRAPQTALIKSASSGAAPQDRKMPFNGLAEFEKLVPIGKKSGYVMEALGAPDEIIAGPGADRVYNYGYPRPDGSEIHALVIIHDGAVSERQLHEFLRQTPGGEFTSSRQITS